VKEPVGGTTPLHAWDAVVEMVPAVGLQVLTPRLLTSPVIVAIRQTEKPMATVGGLLLEAGAGRKVVLGTIMTDTATLEVTVNGLLFTVIWAVKVAVKVYVPAIVNRRLLKVATPFDAATVVVPLTVPAPVDVLDEVMVIGAVELVTTLPKVSCMLTTTAGANAVFIEVPVGCVT